MPRERQEFALVTGCGQGGIGEALIHEYIKKGIHAIATILPSEEAGHFDGVAGMTLFRLDVTQEESIKQLLENISKLTDGYLDVLVNNAGICYTMTAIDTDVAMVQRMFDVNIFGPMRMVRSFHPLLIKAAGAIVNIGSVGGISPYVYGSSYNATKAALHHWGNTLRVEMGPFNVRVIVIISGEIGTNILRSDRNRELPSGSYFAPLAEEFKQHVQRTPDTTDRYDYASQVVRQSLNLKPPAWFWYGKASTITWFINAFCFRTLWDRLFWSMFKLQKLKDAMTKTV